MFYIIILKQSMPMNIVIIACYTSLLCLYVRISFSQLLSTKRGKFTQYGCWQQLDHSTLPIDLLGVVVQGNWGTWCGCLSHLDLGTVPMKAENSMLICVHRSRYHSGEVYLFVVSCNEKRRRRRFRDWDTATQGRSHSNIHNALELNGKRWLVFLLWL